MKLPFKIPSIKLPSIKLPKFGKKKAGDDEDDYDDDDDDLEMDFDPSDFIGDENASLGDEPTSPADEGGSPADEGGESDQQAEEPPAMGEGGEGGEGEGTPDTQMGGEDGDDEDEGGEGGILKSRRKMLIIGGGGAAALLLIGGLSWFFMSGDGGEEKVTQEESLVPKVALDIAPKRKIMGTSLNEIAAGAKGPGVGVVVSVVSPVVFASLAPPAVKDGPLGDGNDPLLSEQSPQGPLPKIAEDGRMAWKVYAKSFESQDARPRVALVVRGLGMSEVATDAAIRLLPGGVTLAFDPYAPGLLDWVAQAREAGHEVMIMMPLEPTTFPTDDPGPQGLMTGNDPEENRFRMEYVLSRMTGYVGVMTVMGSKFNTSDEHLRTFLGEIKSRGLMFLEGELGDKSLAPKIATEIGLPRAFADVIIDEIPTKKAIGRQLIELEAILAKQPAALAVAEAYPASIERLAAWTAGLEAKNFVLAPVSALADKQLVQ